MFDNYDMSDKLGETRLQAGWEELMGKTIAKNTKKLYIKNGVLYLEIVSASLKNELIYHELIIVEKVNQFSGSRLISSIKVK